MKIKKNIKNGTISLLKKGGPIEIFSLVITSKNIGYVVPIKTTDKKYIINQLLIKIDVSLLIKKNFFSGLLSLTWYIKNKIIDKNINENRNIKIKTPLSGSFANVCTEFNIPDLTKKVPIILKVNVAIDNIIVHDFRKFLFSSTMTV